jgi:hypothetical protein
MSKGRDKGANGAARLMDGAFHGLIVLVDIEHLRLGAGLQVFASNCVIGPGRNGCSGKERAGEDGCKIALHSFCLWIRNTGGNWTYEKFHPGRAFFF